MIKAQEKNIAPFYDIFGFLFIRIIERSEKDWACSPGRDNEDYPGRTELISYLSFLNYVDQLIGEAHPLIGEALADCLIQHFFPEIVLPRNDQNPS
jgi:hypothetical protein